MTIPVTQELIGDSVVDIDAAIDRMEYKNSLRSTESYCKAWGIPVPVDLSIKMRRAGIFPRAYKGAGDYDTVRGEYWEAVYDAVAGYLESKRPSTTFKGAMSRAVADAFIDAVEIGYRDGGGELPLDENTSEWLNVQQAKELANVDSLFVSLAGLRKEDDTDPIEIGFSRAEGYSNTIDGLYNQAVLHGMKNKMLTFNRASDTKESCEDCLKLRGKRHRASWWISHDYVPPTGTGLACSPGGHCGDGLFGDDGNVVTI